MPPKLTHEIITAAITGFKAQKSSLDAQIAELRAMLSGGSAESATATATPELKTHKRRKMSAAGRARIAAAQRARWAASKKAVKPTPATSEAPKPKRKLSRAGRAAIVAATKKRWALKRAAEGAKAAPKKAARKAAGKKATPKKAAPASEAATQ